MPETVQHGLTGLIVPARDPEALASALVELVSDPERARTMGESGRSRFFERYTWDTVADRMIREIEKRL
jgi:glycosyltransferase involved in cell wall biosynthesis